MKEKRGTNSCRVTTPGRTVPSPACLLEGGFRVKENCYKSQVNNLRVQQETVPVRLTKRKRPTLNACFELDYYMFAFPQHIRSYVPAAGQFSRALQRQVEMNCTIKICSTFQALEATPSGEVESCSEPNA